MKQQLFTVSGMSCASCSSRVESVVKALPHVSEVQVNLLTRSMRVVYAASATGEEAIITAVRKAGYDAVPALPQTRPVRQTDTMKRRLAGSAAALIPMVLLHHLHPGSLSQLLQFLLLAPILYLNRSIFSTGCKAILHRAPNMNSLIALGAGAGILYTLMDALLLHSGAAYLESAGMILTLTTLGKWLESRASAHTGDALNELESLLPLTATIQRGDKLISLPAEEVQPCDSLLIEAGARVPVDSIVTDGFSGIDESSLTGESIPVLKQKGSRIYAGTINGNGVLQASALCTRQNSALSGIIRMAAETAASKAPIARLADRISAVFVPLVTGIALITALLWLLYGEPAAFAMGCAIAVLVVSCPCALGLATPVAIMAGAGRGATQGILFSNAAVLETARRTTAVILDKTGTLTAGVPIVTGIYPAEDSSRDELLQLAATMEHGSTHPLAHAIRKATADFRPAAAESRVYQPGRGISALVQGKLCLAGNAAMMKEHQLEIPANLPDADTPLYFAEQGHLLGCICVSDPLKSGSAAAVAAMKLAGLRVIMMSGDRLEAVRRIAHEAGVEEFHAEVMPQDKAALVSRLQAEGHFVAMVGDGINDAPALSRADVGIAIGAGTDVAISSAGIVLVRNELMDAVAALQLSRATIRIIRQNLFWAFFYNILAIPMAAGLYYPLLGWKLTPAVAAAAMSLSSLFVVCNALRLQKLVFNTAVKTTMHTITLSVYGMMCPHCERHVAQALAAIPGVSSVSADHRNNSVTLECSTTIDTDLLAATIQKAGYEYKGLL